MPFNNNQGQTVVWGSKEIVLRDWSSGTRQSPPSAQPLPYSSVVPSTPASILEGSSSCSACWWGTPSPAGPS